MKVYDRALSESEIQEHAGVGGEGLFAATSFSESSASLTARNDDIVEVDGASVYINVGESPELNYGIGDFTVVVTARTADASFAFEGTPPWPPTRGEPTPDPTQADSGLMGEDTPLPPLRGDYTPLPPSKGGLHPLPPSRGDYTPLPPSRGDYTSQPSSRGDYKGSVSHVAVGVRQGKDLFLYLDGAVQAQKKVGAGRITRLKVNVGLDDVSTHAIIEDVKLSPYALSPEEIAGLSSESELK